MSGFKLIHISKGGPIVRGFLWSFYPYSSRLFNWDQCNGSVDQCLWCNFILSGSHYQLEHSAVCCCLYRDCLSMLCLVAWTNHLPLYFGLLFDISFLNESCFISFSLKSYYNKIYVLTIPSSDCVSDGLSHQILLMKHKYTQKHTNIAIV